MKNKTTLQKLALITVILLASNLIPGILVAIATFDPSAMLESPRMAAHPYLFGWAMNIALFGVTMLCAVGIKLAEYSQTGKWNRSIFSDF